MNLKTILALPLAALALAAAAPAEASNYRQPAGQSSYRVVCAPVFVCTRVVASRFECRYATDRCGRRYSYRVKVVTYANVYSDGSQRRYTRTYRA